jgi:hypothetical protein
MQIITPKFKRKTNPMGVYKILFDDQYFYIGGSCFLKNRFRHWKTRLRAGNPKNKNIKSILHQTQKAKFVVLERIFNKEQLRDREDFYLKKYFNDPLCLNRCPSAFNNKGLKLFPEEVTEKSNRQKGKKLNRISSPEITELHRKKSIERGLGSSVAVLDLNGNVMKIYNSINECCRDQNTDRKTLSGIFKGKRKTTKGKTYRKIDSEGNIKEPIKRPSRRPGNPKGHHLNPAGMMKIKEWINTHIEYKRYVSVAKFSKEGDFICKYDSICAAARELNTDHGNLNRRMKNMHFINGFLYFPLNKQIEYPFPVMAALQANSGL